jgi:AhpD family alkylhydroperoxidase
MRQPLVDLSSSPAAAEVAGTIAGQRWGSVSALYGMLLHAPAVAEGWVALGTAVRRRTSLDDRLRELLICMVARVCDQSYEWASHSRLAAAAGATEAELAALPAWESCPTFSPRERAVLALAGATAQGTVDDEAFGRAAAALDRTELVEVVATAAYYTGTARFLSAFAIEAGADGLPASGAPLT